MFGMGTGVSPRQLSPEKSEKIDGKLNARTLTGLKPVRIISTGKLNALLHLHIRPINQVVYLDPFALAGNETLSWEELGA